MIAIISTILIALIVGFTWACALASADYDEIETEKEREENETD